jgi:hypothetical protein
VLSYVFTLNVEHMSGWYSHTDSIDLAVYDRSCCRDRGFESSLGGMDVCLLEVVCVVR